MIWIVAAYFAGLLSAVALAYLALAALEGVDPPDHTGD